MINLIGCNKENFLKLLESMQYKPKKMKDNKKEELFTYRPKMIKNKIEKNNKKFNKNNPYDKLSEKRFR